MAITLLGKPQEISSGYNPMYFYADSDKKAIESFRYTVEVRNEITGTVMANLKRKPRFGDGYLAVNIQKILAGDLSDFTEDQDVNNIVTGFNPTPGSGFKYRVRIGEEYIYEWEFYDTFFASGMVRFVSVAQSAYQVGDVLNVDGAGVKYDFTTNNSISGNAGFLATNNLFVGDTIFVKQDDPYTYNVYEGYHELTAVTGASVTIDLPFQGSTPIEPGEFWGNYQYNGLQVVTSVGIIGPGDPGYSDYPGEYYVEIDVPYGNNSNAHDFTATYADGRLNEIENLSQTYGYVFNGAEGHNSWINWLGSDYDPLGVGQKFLTTLPDNWTVSLEDDVFLNIVNKESTIFNYNGYLNTYDAAGTLIGEYQWEDLALNTSSIVNVSVGPNWFNNAGLELTNLSGPVIPITCDVAYYTVSVETFFDVKQSDTRTFYVDCSCYGRFTNYPVLFMDRFGSFVPFDFSLANKQEVRIDREQYKRFIGDLSGSAYAYNASESSMRTFNTELTEKWTISTDWLTEVESTFFEQLVTSPVALIKVDGVYVPFQIEDKRHERKRKVNVKNIRYELDFMMANPNTIQSL